MQKEKGRRQQPETLTGVIVWFCRPPVCCAYLLGSLHTQRRIRLTDHTDLACYLSVSLEKARVSPDTLQEESCGKKDKRGNPARDLDWCYCLVLLACPLLCLPMRIVAYTTLHLTNRPHRLGCLPFSFIGAGKGSPDSLQEETRRTVQGQLA